MDRIEIINRIIEEQQKVLESLKATVERYKTASDLDEESTHDPEDFSQQTQAKDMQLRYEKMLSDAEFNLHFLEKEKKEKHDKIEKGALVETDHHFLFVGISVHPFHVGDKEVLSFSEKAPVFGNIKSHQIGDSVIIGEQTMKIIDFG
jgi:hypothetical protein